MSHNTRKILGLATAVLMAGSVLGACGAGTSDGDDPRPEVLQVAAALYPVEEIVSRVGGDRIDVLALTPPGGDSHDVELSAKTLDELARADAVFFLGEDFQPSVESAVAGLDGSVVTVDLLEAVTLIEAKEDESHGDEEHAHGDEEHSDKDAHGDEEHAHGEHDPHVWTDPANMALMARQVAQTLTTIDPDHASEYSANADAFAAEMERLGADFDAAFADCAADTVVTSHEAFAYLFARLGLASVTVAGINPDDQPSAKELAAIADIARDSGVTTIYLDATASERLGQTIADEIGAEVAILDPVETVTRADLDGGETYESIQRRNMDTLRRGLGCQS